MNMILAADRNWGIGKDNHLLVHLPGDLRFFKKMTEGGVVIVGRKTLESFPGGKPLPNREHIVITGNPACITPFKEQCTAAGSIEEALKIASYKDEERCFVIGGAMIYRQMLAYCDTVYVTKIDEEFPADSYFENLDKNEKFFIECESPVQEENGVRYKFVKYKRKTKEKNYVEK